MCPTRAPGTTSSMPSRKPLPARMITTNTVLRPSITGELIFSRGVSISTMRIGISRVTS